jgi:hypothetical protein
MITCELTTDLVFSVPADKFQNAFYDFIFPVQVLPEKEFLDLANRLSKPKLLAYLMAGEPLGISDFPRDNRDIQTRTYEYFKDIDNEAVKTIMFCALDCYMTDALLFPW